MEYPDIVDLDESIEKHGHLRNSIIDGDGRMEMNMQHLVGHHGILFHIGNGSPAMLRLKDVEQELDKARKCIPSGVNLRLLGMPLLTDKTTLDDILTTRLDAGENVMSWKAFLSGVSNDGGNSVTDFRKMKDVIHAFYEPLIGAPTLVLEIHAERKFTREGRRLEMRDREWYAVRTDVEELLGQHPALTVIVKHVSDARTLRKIERWRKEGYNVYAEICPHYLVRCHEDLYEGPGGGTAFNLHDLCWPIYKDERSMETLRKYVLAGTDWIVFGTDWACHAHDPMLEKGVKVNYDGVVVGGVTILPSVAKSLLIDLFLEHSSIENLNKYLSGVARSLHNFPPSERKVRYIRKPWVVPMQIEGEGPNGTTIIALPFMRGQQMNWQLEAA